MVFFIASLSRVARCLRLHFRSFTVFHHWEMSPGLPLHRGAFLLHSTLEELFRIAGPGVRRISLKWGRVGWRVGWLCLLLVLGGSASPLIPTLWWVLQWCIPLSAVTIIPPSPCWLCTLPSVDWPCATCLVCGNKRLEHHWAGGLLSLMLLWCFCPFILVAGQRAPPALY